MYETVLESFQLAKSLGIKTAFDLNYRPNLWIKNQHNADEVKKVILDKLKLLYALTDLFLPSYEDLQLLYGIKTIEDAVSFLQQLPCSPIYLKAGKKGVLKITKTGIENVVFEEAVPFPTDFIGAGDVVNAHILKMY